jgi:hypothetical protein
MEGKQKSLEICAPDFFAAQALSNTFQSLLKAPWTSD